MKTLLLGAQEQMISVVPVCVSVPDDATDEELLALKGAALWAIINEVTDWDDSFTDNSIAYVDRECDPDVHGYDVSELGVQVRMERNDKGVLVPVKK